MKSIKILTDLFFYRFLSICTIWLITTNGLLAQFTIEVTVLSGGATTTCTDGGLFGETPGEATWGVAIEDEEVEFYDNTCPNLISYPNIDYIHFTRVVDCLSDLNGGELFVCFWTFDNDLGAFNKCSLTKDNIDKGCLEVPCGNFGLPRPGTDSVYNFDPVDPALTSDGFLRFRITVSEDASNRDFAINDRICQAVDFGTLGQSVTIGDPTPSNFTNFCATNLLEPDPATTGGSWTNDAGTWFSFTTSAKPGQVQIVAQSDPDDTGNPINLQLALYESDNGACDGNLQLIKDQFIGAELDEILTTDCLDPNTTYFVLVDGEVTTSGSFFGQFSLAISEVDIPSVTNDEICDAITLEVSTGSNNIGKYSNICATNNNDPATISGLNITNSVWFQFVPPVSRSVFINIDSDRDTDPIEPEMTVFVAPTNNCSDNLVEVPSQRSPGGVSSVFYTLECLNPKSTYYILVDGTDNDPTGIFSIIAAEGPYPAPMPFDTLICRGDVLNIGNKSYANTGVYLDTIVNTNNDCVEIVETNLRVVEPVQLKLDVGQLARGEGMPGGAMVANAQFGTGSYDFIWSTGSMNQVANNLIGGEEYCVTVTDRNAGCIADTCFLMPFPIPTLARITNDTVDCSSDLVGEIQLEITEGRPPYQYQVRGIDDPSFISIGVIAKNDTLINIENIPVGNYNISTIDGDNFGDNFEATVSAPDPITITLLEEIDASCFQTCNGLIEIRASGGQGIYDFSWGEGLGKAAILTDVCAGDYTLTITDENQCQDSMQFTILEPQTPNIGFFNVNPVTCFGEENGTATLTINEQINTVLWDNGATTENVTNLDAGTHQVIITNDDGCQYVDSVNIEQPDAPLVTTIDVTETIACGGDTNGVLTDATTGGNGNYEYIWNNGETSDFIDNLPAGIYELIVRDEKGCIGDAMVTLEEPTPIDATISATDVNCLEGQNSGTIQIANATGGSAPYRYAVNNQNFISNTEITNLSAGTYAVLMQDDKGCEKTFDNLVISEPPALSVDLGDDLEIKLGTSIDLNANVSGNVTYEWFSTDSLSCLDCATITAKPSNTANYTVRVTGVRTGCVAEDQITIAVSKARELYVPNAFSPNGDGVNDELSLLGGLDIDKVLSFEIYSRDGARVFKRDNFRLADGILWDGSYNGQNLSTDVFIYFAEIEFIDGVTEIFRGDFTLVR